jgi:hypothetical protein
VVACPLLHCHCEAHSAAAISVGEALTPECQGDGDYHGRERRGLAMTVMLVSVMLMPAPFITDLVNRLYLHYAFLYFKAVTSPYNFLQLETAFLRRFELPA